MTATTTRAVNLTVEERIEDLAWLADHGASLTEAGQRTGSNRAATERFLRRHHQTELLAQLLSQDPPPKPRTPMLTRYRKWRTSPEGAAIYARLQRHMDHLRAYPDPRDTPEAQAARRAVIDVKVRR